MAATAQKDSGNSKETLGFQAEIKQVLQLMIRSVYSNKEIFLRELISNASDACDKLRFQAISDDKIYEGDSDLKIKVNFDAEKKTITVADNGIGMTRDEVIENIGTIAKSGTKEFFAQLTGDQQKDAQLIGQFGVGFYSAFIVADKVSLKTRKAGEGKAVLWESDGQGEFTIEETEMDGRGTEVTLHVREEDKDFLDQYRLQTVIKKFSDHISLPVVMTVTEEVEGKKETKDEVVNKASALWTRSKSEVKKEEYDEFYKSVSHDFSNPLAHIHSKMEGNLEYSMLLFVPEKAPFDLWTQEHQVGVKLYVNRIFIMDDADKLLPKYLRFIRGVVDSSDLQLNVSRELLQDNQIIQTIKNTAVKKILDLLEDMAENDKEKFKTFWNEFGRVFKEGVVEDFVNKDRIGKICRFSTTFDDKEEQEVSLDDYIFRLKKDQDKIYYLIADSHSSAKNSPLLEVFRKKGVEVLLLSDRVDHWFVSHLKTYKDKEFYSVSKGDVNLSENPEEDKKKEEETETEFKSFLDKVKETLKDKVSDVKLSHRLTSSPVCLVSHKDDLDPNLKQIFAAVGQEASQMKPILEINPDHKLIEKLKSETADGKFNDLSLLLFEQAVLSDGGTLEDPAQFVRRVNDFIE